VTSVGSGGVGVSDRVSHIQSGPKIIRLTFLAYPVHDSASSNGGCGSGRGSRITCSSSSHSSRLP